MFSNDEVLDSSSSSSDNERLQDSLAFRSPILHSQNIREEKEVRLNRVPLKQNDYESYEAFSKKKQEAESEKNTSRHTANLLETLDSRHSADKPQAVLEFRTNPLKVKQRRVMVEGSQPSINGGVTSEVSSEREPNSSHIKNLLELEIEKNRQLQRRLFQRERQTVELQTKLEQQKKPKRGRSGYRSASPNLFHLRTVRQIESEITQLKKKYREIEKSPRNEKAMEGLKRENSTMKSQNRKYEKFFRAFADSMNLLQGGKRCGSDVKDVWLCWKELFPKVAERLSTKRTDS